MKRQIKFRVWNGDKMEFFTLKELYWRGEDTGDYDFPDGLEVMQFTGLKDKNGKNIYEGDIVKTIYDKRVYCEMLEKIRYKIKHLGEVFYSSCYFCVKIFSGSDDDFIDLSEFVSHQETVCLEVVGNIYKNPELLEVK